jgi:predicted  nucleic acid-binding Zn-ribbon protein
MRKTKPKQSDLQTEIFNLSNIAGNLAKENALLRGRVDSMQHRTDALEALVEQLRGEVRAKHKDYEDRETERASLEKENAELEERIEDLEEASDPDTISAEVHDFMRSEGLLPVSLDAPLFLAPAHYITGLYEAIQKAVPE